MIEVWDISHLGHIVLVELWLTKAACPRLTHAHRILGHRYGVLCGRNCRLLALAVVSREQLLGCHIQDAVIGKAVTETPVVLRSDVALACPLVVTPPHISQREELLDLVGVVLQTLLRVVGVAIIRVVGVGLGSLIVVWIWILHPSAAGVVVWVAVVEQQRLAIPLKPEVGVFLLLVNAVV